MRYILPLLLMLGGCATPTLRLAAPVYWLGWRLIRLADKIDGKQPKK